MKLMTLFAVAFLGCGGVQDETACTRMAVESCDRRFYCLVPDQSTADYSACVQDMRKSCSGWAEDKSESCRAAIHDQDCGQLHAHVIPDACMF